MKTPLQFRLVYGTINTMGVLCGAPNEGESVLMKKYTYLLFDVDNTLLDFDRSEHDAMADALVEHGFAADDEMINHFNLHRLKCFCDIFRHFPYNTAKIPHNYFMRDFSYYLQFVEVIFCHKFFLMFVHKQSNCLF